MSKNHRFYAVDVSAPNSFIGGFFGFILGLFGGLILAIMGVLASATWDGQPSPPVWSQLLGVVFLILAIAAPFFGAWVGATQLNLGHRGSGSTVTQPKEEFAECRNCKHVYIPPATFCPYCGHRLSR